METRILIPEVLKIVSHYHTSKNKHKISASNPSNNSSSSSSPQRTRNASGGDRTEETIRIEKPTSSSGRGQQLDRESEYNSSEESEDELNVSSNSERGTIGEIDKSSTSAARRKSRRTTQLYQNHTILQSPSSSSHDTDTGSEDEESSDEIDKTDELVSSAMPKMKIKKKSKRRALRQKNASSVIKIYARQKLRKGTVLSPNEGVVKVLNLHGLESLANDDIRFVFGCFDRLMEDPLKSAQKIRLCNWLRFIPRKATQFGSKVNLIAKFLNRRPIIECSKDLVAGEELVIFFDLDSITRDLQQECRIEIKSELHSTEAPLDLSKSPTMISYNSPPSSSSSSTSSYRSPILDHDDLLEKSPSPQSNDDSFARNSKNPFSIRNVLHSTGSLFKSRSSENHQLNILTPPLSSSKLNLSSPTFSNQNSDSSASLMLNSPPPTTSINPLLMFDHHDSLSANKKKFSQLHLHKFLSQYGFSPSIVSSTATAANNASSSSSASNNNNIIPNSSTLLRPILRTRGRERSLLPCEVCSKAFDRPSLLKRHMRTHTGEKPHVCDTCGKGFSTSSSLNTHRRIHSGEKPHQCPICGKRFTASSNLYYHRMTHNKEKPHKCLLCGKSFPTPGDLKSHQYVHSGSWPFSCRICNRGFSKQTNLRNHLLLHSGDKPHTCKICHKKFALACNLRAHLRTHEEDPVSTCLGCKRNYISSLNMIVNGHCRPCHLKLQQKQSGLVQTELSASEHNPSALFGPTGAKFNPFGTLTSDITIPQPNLTIHNNKEIGEKPSQQTSIGNTFPLAYLPGFHQQNFHNPATSTTLPTPANALLHHQNHLENFTRPNPFLEQLLEWNWRVAKETVGNLGLMQQKLFESQMLAAQLMTRSPGSMADILRLQASVGLNKFEDGLSTIPAILNSNSDFRNSEQKSEK